MARAVNAFNLDLVNALCEAIVEAPKNGARGIVLSGAQGMFLAGVDVPALIQRDRAGVRDSGKHSSPCAARSQHRRFPPSPQ